MQTVVETSSYIADARAAGVSTAGREAIVWTVSSDPKAGELIPGTGGARKLRFAQEGRGKRGSYRVISFYAAKDVPVCLLALVAKGQRADISQTARNALKVELRAIADDYRAGVRKRVVQLKRSKKRARE
jgi:hypothetical protein